MYKNGQHYGQNRACAHSGDVNAVSAYRQLKKRAALQLLKPDYTRRALSLFFFFGAQGRIITAEEGDGGQGQKRTGKKERKKE